MESGWWSWLFGGPVEAAEPHERTRVTIVVVGDSGVGKSALISSLVHGEVQAELPRVLPVTNSDDSLHPFQIVDTEGPGEGQGVSQELLSTIALASAVVVCVDSTGSTASLVDRWLPAIATARPGQITPVTVCLTKADQVHSVPEDTIHLLHQQREQYADSLWMSVYFVSALQLQGPGAGAQRPLDVFQKALDCACSPIGPLYDPVAKRLTPKCEAALRLVFRESDQGRKGVLMDDDLRQFQRRCFGLELTQQDLALLKQVVAQADESGLSAERYITPAGFLALNTFFLADPHNRASETVWQSLVKFGFEFEPIPLRHVDSTNLAATLPKHRVQFSGPALAFIRLLHRQFSLVQDTPELRLPLSGLGAMLAVLDEPPRPLASPASHLAVENDGLSQEQFVMLWQASLVLQPSLTVRALARLGYNRSTPMWSKHDKDVVCCVLAGKAGVGKSSLRCALDPSGAALEGETICRREVELEGSLFQQSGTAKVTVVAKEVGGDSPTLSEEDLCAADCVVLCFDSTKRETLKFAQRVQQHVAAHSDLPVLYVGTMADVDEEPRAVHQECLVFCNSEGLSPPCLTVANNRTQADRVMQSALRVCFDPSLSTPKATRTRQHKQLLRLAGAALAVGVACGLVVGLWAWSRRRAAPLVVEAPRPPPPPPLSPLQQKLQDRWNRVESKAHEAWDTFRAAVGK